MDTNSPVKNTETVHVKLDIPKDLHRKLKIIAAETDRTLGELLLVALQGYGQRYGQPTTDNPTGWKG